MRPFWNAELRTKRLRIISVALICLALLAYIDWFTGPSVSVTCFYLIPVFFLSWYGGWRLGVVVAAMHAVIWLAIDLEWLRGFSPIVFWNFAVRFITFSAVVWLVRLSKNLTVEVERLVGEKTISLKREVETRAANEQAIRNLANQLSAAEDAERRRLGLELHDSLGQSLTLLKLRLESFAADMPGDPRVAAMQESLSILASIIRQVRTLTFELYPSMLDQLGLTTALRHYADQIAPQVNARIRVADTGPEVTMPAENAAFLFRAVKELLNNGLKHGAARELVVQIRRRHDSVRVVVSDDGTGFDPQSIAKPGLGLSWMRERLHSLGGTLELESAPRQGTRVAIDLPLVVRPSPPRPQEESLIHGHAAAG